jgi:aryl-alcohol dehydrogenase-like predicted oxidoreductase
MKKRKLGSQGLEVSALGLGCMGMSEFYGRTDNAESVKVIHRALELGINYLDTADMYGPYKNEELVGKALRGKRDKAIISTKFGIVRLSDDRRSVSGKPDYVKSSCEGSLKRLNTDYIDLYYQHRVDPQTPIEETIGAMSELVKEGKVRFIGLSEASVKTIKLAHNVHPVTALQSEYSLWCREPEAEVIPALRRLGIGFVAYSPLGRGFLTGKFNSPGDFEPDDFRTKTSRFQGENFKKNLHLLKKVKNLADEKNVTTAQLALAWILHKGDDIVPIPGTKRIKYLEENVKAGKLKLSESEISGIEEVMPPGSAAGLRYPEPSMKLLNQ